MTKLDNYEKKTKWAFTNVLLTVSAILNLQESFFGMILAYIFEKLKQTDKAERDLCWNIAIYFHFTKYLN